MPELPAGLRERGQGWGRVWTQPRGAPSSPSPHQGWCRGSRAVPAGSTSTAQHCSAAGIPPMCAGWAPRAPRGLEATPAPRVSLPAGWIQQQGHGRGRAGCSEPPQCWCQRRSPGHAGGGARGAVGTTSLGLSSGSPGGPCAPRDIPPCFPLFPTAGEGWVRVPGSGSAAQCLRSARIWLRSPSWAQLHASSSWGLAGARAQPVAPAAAASNWGGGLEPP